MSSQAGSTQEKDTQKSAPALGGNGPFSGSHPEGEAGDCLRGSLAQRSGFSSPQPVCPERRQVLAQPLL